MLNYLKKISVKDSYLSLIKTVKNGYYSYQPIILKALEEGINPFFSKIVSMASDFFSSNTPITYKSLEEDVKTKIDYYSTVLKFAPIKEIIELIPSLNIWSKAMDIVLTYSEEQLQEQSKKLSVYTQLNKSTTQTGQVVETTIEEDFTNLEIVTGIPNNGNQPFAIRPLLELTQDGKYQQIGQTIFEDFSNEELSVLGNIEA